MLSRAYPCLPWLLLLFTGCAAHRPATLPQQAVRADLAPSGTLPSVGDVSFRVGASLTGGGMGSLLLLGRGMDRVAKRGH